MVRFAEWRMPIAARPFETELVDEDEEAIGEAECIAGRSSSDRWGDTAGWAAASVIGERSGKGGGCGGAGGVGGRCCQAEEQVQRG